MPKYTPAQFTPEEEAIVMEARRTGDITALTAHFFALPKSGSRWMPDDAIGHYRHLFTYQQLYALWQQADYGDEFEVRSGDYVYPIIVDPVGEHFEFVLRHGLLLPDWIKPIVAPSTDVALVISGTGSGKCLPGRSLVYCADGTRKRIDEVKIGDVLVGVDWRFKSAEQTVTGFVSNGVKPLLKIKTSLGATIECTPNHPLLKVSGWVNSENLTIGDRIALPRSLPESPYAKTLSDDELAVLGYIIGDGGITGESVIFTNDDERVKSDFKERIEAMGHCVTRANSRNRAFSWRVNGVKDGRHSLLISWLRELGIMGRGSHEKFVPRKVFEQPNKSIALFLNRLYACDGWATVSKSSGQGTIGYGTVSRDLAEDVRICLLKFGIFGRIRGRTTYCGGKPFWSYEVVITGKRNVKLFAAEIGIFSKEAAVESAAAAYSEHSGRESGSDDVVPADEVRQYILRRGAQNGIPGYKTDGEKFRIRHKNLTRWKIGEYAEWLHDEFLRDLADSDVYWDRIVSIERVAEEETFDIEVFPDHNFVVDGVIAHNTSGVAIAALAYCLMYPGFEFMNLAPSEKQAKLIMAELDKWAGGSRFRDFVQITSRHKLYTEKPYALATIVSPLDPRYPSHFACQTIGVQSADQILGESKDWFNLDECQLIADLSAIIPKAVTRSRAQRPDGSSRWTKMTMLTNPADDPARMENLEQARQRIAAINENPEQYGARITAIYRDNIESGVNLYVTKKQAAYHRAMMDAADQSRWLGGSVEAYAYTTEIPVKLIKDNIDPVMDDEIRVRGLHNARSREGMGLIRYEMPREEGRIYMVVGDPGKNNAVKIDFNNVPVVLAFDVTHFLEEPAKLVYFAMLDGNGTEHAWLNAFRYAMLKYQARGYYDATNQPGFTAAGAFNNSLDFEYDGRQIKSPALFQVDELTLANNNKRFARTLFTLLAQDGQFAWPKIEALIHQAAKYAETGPGVKKLPDDILAALFVYCLALRVESTLWDRVVTRYYMPEFDEVQAKVIEEATRPVGMSRSAARSSLGRSRRSWR